jgi:Lrp/AsnC family transcriptional regulator for asnA, asnC and gidA
LNTQPKIDEVDVRILKALLKDPRTSFADIAKDCEMSANAIRMRFKRLKKEGVIKGAIMQVNPKSLGYDCICHLGIQVDVNEEANVLEFLEKTPCIIGSNQQIGKFNIVSFLALKNVDELAHTVELVKSHPHVFSVEVGIWVDVVQLDHPDNLVIEPVDELPHISELTSKDEKPKPKIIHSNVVSELAEEKHLTVSHELDKTDLLIIGILSENARMSFRKIAEQLGISTQSVIRRYNRLKKDVLPYSSITVDLEKVGYMGYASLGTTISNQYKISKIFERILQIPNIITAFRVLGPVHIVVGVPFANIEQLFKLYQEVAKIPGVIQIDLFLHKQFPKWPLNIFPKLVSKLLQNT